LTIAIYPGSFDPVTNGHVDIANRAAGLFEEFIISVYDVPQKHLMFSTEERVGLARKAVAHLPNVRVEPYSGLTVGFARKVNASVIVRGLRGIELVCLMASLEHQFISSSLLKEACELGGDIASLVPKHVAVALAERFGVARK
jgi:pantetheine-phosphate adenylyltransferase